MLLIKTIDVEIIKGGESHLVSNNRITGTSLEVLSFIPGDIQQNNVFRDDIDGRNRLYAGSEDKYRTINMSVRACAYDAQDVSHLRDAVNELFDGVYYLREMRIRSHDVQFELPGASTGGMQQSEPEYVNGKQIQVTKVNSIDIDDSDLRAVFNVEFETVDLPYFESIYTTKELNDTGYDAVVERYGLVDGIDSDNTQYVFTSHHFDVYNAGNVKVEPESMYLKITIKGLRTDGSFKLTNMTTGEAFKFTKAVRGKSITLDGMVVRESVYNALRDTNRQFVSLVPGKNTFEVSGGIFDYAIINFKYYYR